MHIPEIRKLLLEDNNVDFSFAKELSKTKTLTNLYGYDFEKRSMVKSGNASKS